MRLRNTSQGPAAAPSNGLDGTADNSSALEIVLGTSTPSAVAYLLVVPSRSWPESGNSTSFIAAVQEANFSATDVFSGTESGNFSTTLGLEIAQAGSSYTHLRNTYSGVSHASVKLLSCLVDVSSPLAVLVAAKLPGRGFSTVHVHASNLPGGCMEDSSGEVAGAFEGTCRNTTYQRVALTRVPDSSLCS